MAAPGNLRDTVVSIWLKAEDLFLGSAAFIAPGLVFTAEHVIKDRDPKDIYLDLVHGHRRFTPTEFHRHETLDIAVMDLGREIPGQDVARMDGQQTGLEGTLVDLYGVSPISHNRDECQGYTLGTWHDETRTYLFDHAQLKGFSGGIVVLDGVVIGIMTRRHKTEQLGVMLPLAEVADWLQPLLPNTISVLNPVHATSQTELAQHAFTRDVRREIIKCLERQALRPLRAHLLAHATDAQWGDKPEDALVSLNDAFSIDASIRHLRQATRTCLQELAEQGPEVVQSLRSGALDIFGWLVLLTVSEDWVKQKLANGASGIAKQHFQDLMGAVYLELPVETETGTQVVEARLREQSASFELDDQGYAVRSPNHVRLGDLELGIGLDDELDQIKKLIWATVFKGIEAPALFRTFDDERLKETLEIRYQDGESYYVMLPANRGGTLAGKKTLLNWLRRDWPHLGAFLIGMETGEQVLVMKESRLWSLTQEFLRMLHSAS